MNYFLDKYNKEFNKNIKGFSGEAVKMLAEYDWPGNVRELQNLVERVVALSENEAPISVEGLPLENVSRNVIKKNLHEALGDFEKRYLKNALAEAGGNQTKAAAMLGIHRTTLISKMKELKLQ